MWSSSGYFWFFISVLNLVEVAVSMTINMTEFRQVDSDFDLAKAVANYKVEDYDPTKIKGYVHGDYKAPNFLSYQRMRAMPRNRTSEEDMKLLEEAHVIINTSSEREREQMLLALKEQAIKDIIPKNIERQPQKDKIKPATTKTEGKIRVKRSGVGKFAEAAKVTNLKMLRIYLTMISNLWTESYTGGTHPLHQDVPKPVVLLFKHRIMEFFFPPVGIDSQRS